MSSLNRSSCNPHHTHEGAFASPRITPEQQLRRSVMSCLLWEDQFYEDGQSIADRIQSTVNLCDPITVGNLAVEVRTKGNLRHVPLLLLCSLLKHPNRNEIFTQERTQSGLHLSEYIYNTIQRADELTELLAVYWRNGKIPLAAQLKKGLARAFTKFSGFQLAKYNRDNTIKLRDVLFLCHAKPKDEEQAETWKQLIGGTLPTPDTWEVELSAGKNKKESFERLIRDGKLGYLALLRNLRNMFNANCDQKLVSDAILARKGGAERVLPFRFVAAARACPQMEPYLDISMLESIRLLPTLKGTTVVLVDVSGSMDRQLSAKSDLTRMDAAAALGAIVNSERLRLFSFSSGLIEVPPRRGMAGIDAIVKSQTHSSTYLGQALEQIFKTVSFDRIIVITDEQSHDTIPPLPKTSKGYLINVASYQNGVAYGPWIKIDGFSERVLSFIHELENESASMVEMTVDTKDLKSFG